MDAKTAFKFAFLARCSAEGLTEEQTRERVKKANGMTLAQGLGDTAAGAGLGAIGGSAIGASPVGGAVLGGATGGGHLWQALKNIGLTGLGVGALGLGIPVGVGAVGGYMAGRAGDIDDQDIQEFKQRELIAEYERLAEEARQQRAARQYSQSLQRMGR